MFDFQFPMIKTTLFVADNDRVHLDALSEILRYTVQASGLPEPCIEVDDTNGLCLHTGDLVLQARWLEAEDEARLSVCLGTMDAQDSVESPALQALLIDILRPLLAALRVSAVDWMESGLRIPADDFIDAVCGDVSEPAAGVAPRRVACQARANTARPRALAVGETTVRADVQGTVRPRRIRLSASKPAQRRRALHKGQPRRQDAHVRSYEAHLVHTLRRPANDAEIAAIRAATGQPSTSARLATWALSLGVATVSLPMALPVLANNLANGEDLRAASLVMGLAGVFSLTFDPVTAISLMALF